MSFFMHSLKLKSQKFSFKFSQFHEEEVTHEPSNACVRSSSWAMHDDEWWNANAMSDAMMRSRGKQDMINQQHDDEWSEIITTWCPHVI